MGRSPSCHSFRMSAPGRGANGSSPKRCRAVTTLRRWSAGKSFSCPLAVAERRTSYLGKGSELLGLQNPFLALVQEARLEQPNQLPEHIVIGLLLRREPSEAVADVHGDLDRRRLHGVIHDYGHI